MSAASGGGRGDGGARKAFVDARVVTERGADGNTAQVNYYWNRARK